MARHRFGLLLIAPLLGAPGSDCLAATPAIDLPHPYYFREMYLPQLTSGPSSVAWSPDSRELIYSMAGSLWRQRTDATRAVQLTDGPGYDYQPDWSPDGRWVIYSSYSDDARELWVLDVRAGHAVPLRTTARSMSNRDSRPTASASCSCPPCTTGTSTCSPPQCTAPASPTWSG